MSSFTLGGHHMIGAEIEFKSLPLSKIEHDVESLVYGTWY